MRKMKKLLLWFGMLTKRLYKKVTFVVILALIPVLVLGYGLAAQEDSGMVTVALAQVGDDPMALEMLDRLDGDSQLIRYERCQSPEQAEDLVWGGKADMAWIFPEDTTERVQAFARDPEAKNAVVRVLAREDNVSLILAREKLAGVLYQACSRIVYIDFVRENVPDLAHLSDEELLTYYDTRDITGELFAFDQTDEAMARAQEVHYLTAPVRGLLAVVVVLCALATALYYIRDDARGTFGWVSAARRPLVELGCQLVSLVNVSAVVLLALALAGLAGSLGRELVTLVLYCLCTASFCMLLRRLCGNVRTLGTLLPLLIVVMLLVCPVFFDLGALRTLQYLFPPTYYINGVYNTAYLLYMLAHTAVTAGLYWLTGRLLKRI